MENPSVNSRWFTSQVTRLEQYSTGFTSPWFYTYSREKVRTLSTSTTMKTIFTPSLWFVLSSERQDLCNTSTFSPRGLTPTATFTPALDMGVGGGGAVWDWNLPPRPWFLPLGIPILQNVNIANNLQRLQFRRRRRNPRRMVGGGWDENPNRRRHFLQQNPAGV